MLDDDTLIEVICITSGPGGNFENVAEATWDNVTTAARTLWDEGYTNKTACKRRLIFCIDGEPIKGMETRP